MPIPAAQHASNNKVKRTIRIYHECEGRIEKSVPRIAIWHHEANGDDEGHFSILLSHE